MSPRLRKTLTGAVWSAAFLGGFGILVMDGDERTRFLTVWVPLFILIGGLMDWFVWNRPSRVKARAERAAELASRPRYGE